MTGPPPRLVPDAELPPYTYVPGGPHPHPTGDPRGHSFGKKPPAEAPPDPDRWQDCRPYLLGIDLFNRGYYWEAHEAWEAAWHASGRDGTTAQFLKALIKVAAAGVKVREGIAPGVRDHAGRAAELFAAVRRDVAQRDRFMGLHLQPLQAFAERLAQEPVPPAQPSRTVRPLFDTLLTPT
jgi:hypothetical protein